MNLKSKILLASALLGGLSLPQVQAQIPITVGSQALLAGYDFDNILTFSTNVRARYSDVWGNNSSPTALMTAGSFNFNGTLGSDNIGIVNATKNATGDINRDINTRAGTGSTFDLGGQTGGEGAIDFGGTGIGGASLNEFSFAFKMANTVNTFDQLILQLWGRDSGTGTPGVSIDWAWSTDAGVTKNSTGLSSVFTTNAFAESVVNFSAISALNGAADVVLIGTIVESGVNARLNIDNVGIYGFAATAIPEPSTYAAMLSVLTLGVVALRRRKAAVLA